MQRRRWRRPAPHRGGCPCRRAAPLRPCGPGRASRAGSKARRRSGIAHAAPSTTTENASPLDATAPERSRKRTAKAAAPNATPTPTTSASRAASPGWRCSHVNTPTTAMTMKRLSQPRRASISAPVASAAAVNAAGTIPDGLSPCPPSTASAPAPSAHAERKNAAEPATDFPSAGPPSAGVPCPESSNRPGRRSPIPTTDASGSETARTRNAVCKM